MMSRLSDEQVREIIVGQLNRAASQPGGAGDPTMVGEVQRRTHLVRQRLGKVLGEVKNIPAQIVFLHKKLTEDRSQFHLLIVIVGMAFMFGVGALFEWLFRRWTASARQRFEQAAPDGLGGKMSYLGLRAVLDVAGIVVFAVASITTFFVLYQGHEPSRNVVMTYFTVILIIRAVSVVSRFMLAPYSPQMRMIPFDDAEAGYYHRCVLWFTGLVAFSMLTLTLMSLLGVPGDPIMLLRIVLGLIVTAILCIMIWRGRGAIAKLIRTDKPGSRLGGQVNAILAETWHLLAIAYVVIVVLLSFVRRLTGEITNPGVALGSLFIVIAVPLLDVAIGRMLLGIKSRRREAHAAEGAAPAEAPGEATAEADAGAPGEAPPEAEADAHDDEDEEVAAVADYLPAIRRGVRIVLVMLGIVIFARLWGFNLFSMADQSVGANVTRMALDVGFTILVAYIGWQIAKTAIDKHLASEGEAVVERGAEGGGTGATRLRTLLPLIRRTLQISIAVMAAMIVLSALGVEIGPLIAGAGIIGLAIGFGAQTLVRDIVSGIFFLLDDAFRVGEYVDIGDVRGSVEKISVRSLILRHHRGPLHTVPFGEIRYLSNYSRDWVIMKLAFRVTYDTDINLVKKIFKRIGAELLDDELLGPGFIEPFKSQGVQSMEDSAIIVRGKFMAKPGQQFMIRKEVYRRVQEAFKDAGIEFAHRRVAVDLPPGIEPGSDEAKHIGEAAAAAVAQEDEGAGGGQKAPA
jgi:small-conductance mechanosensitive channel